MICKTATGSEGPLRPHAGAVPDKLPLLPGCSMSAGPWKGRESYSVLPLGPVVLEQWGEADLGRPPLVLLNNSLQVNPGAVRL